MRRTEEDYKVLENIIYGCEANKEYHKLMRESEDFCQRMVDKFFIFTHYNETDVEFVYEFFKLKKQVKKFLSKFKKEEKITIKVEKWDPHLPRYKHLMDD